jgi:hypothetical protein
MNEKIRYRKLKCPHCGNLVPMELKTTHVENYSAEDSGGSTFDFGTTYEFLKCPACEDVVIRRYNWNEFMDETDEIDYEILFPVNKSFPRGLPPEIQKGLEAADKVKKVDANAYGVLIRRVLEMVCIDRNAKGKTLFIQLGELAKSGEIPEKLVDIAHHLKNFGNVGAHAGKGDLTPAEVPILDDLCRAILEYVYSAPHLAQKAQNSLKALKR